MVKITVLPKSYAKELKLEIILALLEQCHNDSLKSSWKKIIKTGLCKSNCYVYEYFMGPTTAISITERDKMLLNINC